jgi:hypothetical protein
VLFVSPHALAAPLHRELRLATLSFQSRRRRVGA